MKLIDKLIDDYAPPDAPMWERLTQYGRGVVNAALENAAKQYGCARKDLVWGIDKGGAIRVKKRSEVSRSKERESKIGKRECEKPGMIEGFEVQGDKMRIIPGKTFKIEIPAEKEQKAAPAKRGVWTCIKKIPRWIYYFFGFLAALLTCIYLLYWLWTTFWKK